MRLIAACLLLLACSTASADPRADKVSWTDGGKDFDGYLVWDDATDAPRPGLVMVPNWMGVSDAAVAKAKTIAGKDYVILLADVYGRGVRPANAEEAGKTSAAAASDAAVLRSRIQAALATLKASAGKTPLDPERVGAIGFCFGGLVALELARSGADVDGVAVFHSNLMTHQPAKAGELKAPVLVLHGSEDKFVSPESIVAFKDEMRAAKADWQFVEFGGAVHCFAEPDEDGSLPGCEFHAPSHDRSMEMMRDFFGRNFAG